MNKKVQKTIAKVIAKISYEEAKNNVNSTCIFLHEQPVVPTKVKVLNKNIN